MMVAAYIKATKILPGKVKLIEVHHEDRIEWFFEEKDKPS